MLKHQDAKHQRPKRGKSEIRKDELIEATLECISSEGLQNATVRKVAEYAGVTNGLIRFHFGSKDQMIQIAYQRLLEEIFQSSLAVVNEDQLLPRERLRCFLKANLSPPIVTAQTVILWANFLPLTYKDEEMAGIRREAYTKTTALFEELIGAALIDEGKVGMDENCSKQKCRHLAIKLNSLIDGLWLEGSTADNSSYKEELVVIGLDAASDLVGMNLRE
ncbi:TetR family transcriptional regulator C-terminal domain-containing protein [Kiloniella majae]|uniref:TetR family transcriptional regulator C-terminal domain-containing protein n=1 Tax=Kiloniella majae TaxID=1938558 RepID=UPI000A27759A|nr:TetR family transcriptional regulator [Kiloniella majae]